MELTGRLNSCKVPLDGLESPERHRQSLVGEVSETVGVGLEAPVDLVEGPDLRRWLHRAGPHRLPGLARIWLAKARLERARWARDPEPVLRLLARLRGELRREHPLSQEELAVDGRDLISLGLKPGPEFGEILGSLMEQVLEDPSLNQRDRLLRAVEAWLAREG